MALFNKLGYKAEPRGRAPELNAEVCAYGIRKAGAHYAFCNEPVRGNGSALLHGAEYIVKQKGTYLVTRKHAEFAVLFPHGKTHSVRIRVGGNYCVRIDLIRKLHRKRKRPRVLRIRGGNGREVPVRLALLFHYAHVCYARKLQYVLHGQIAAAVQGSVYHFKRIALLLNKLGPLHN